MTWNEWLVHPAGGAQDNASLQAIIDSQPDEQRDALRGLYRRFTDQLMGSIEALGAP